MRILIVKLSAIGDCLLASPVAQALKETFPDCHLGWAVHAHCAPVVAGNRFLDRVHRLPRKQFIKHLPSLTRELRAEKYDIALDLQGLFKSGLIAALSGAKRRVGPEEAREGAPLFYTERVARGIHQGEHVVPGYLRLAAAIGARWDEEPPMTLPYSPEDLKLATELLHDLPADAPRVIINPSAGKAIKQWSPERFGALADQLVNERGAVPIITGAPSDRPLADAVLNAMKSRDRAKDLTGKTNLNQLAALFTQVQLFIGGDTGPMHIAQASGTRVLALFGPTDPTILGPRHPKHQTLTLNLECSPCRHRVCPIGRPCLDTMEVAAVARVAKQMLDQQA